MFEDIELLLTQSTKKQNEFLSLQYEKNLDSYICNDISNKLKNSLFNKNYQDFFEILNHPIRSIYFPLNQENTDFIMDVFLSSLRNYNIHYLQKFKTDFNPPISLNNNFFLQILNFKSIPLINFCVTNKLPLSFDNSLYCANGIFNNPQNHHVLNSLIQNNLINKLPLITNLSKMNKTYLPKLTKKQLNDNISFINDYIDNYTSKNKLNNTILHSIKTKNVLKKI